MSNEPAPASAKVSEIVNQISNKNLESLFQTRREDGWSAERKRCENKLGKYKKLLDDVTPEARRSPEGCQTRADVLIIANGVAPNTEEFELARDVMSKLVVSNRTDVVGFALQIYYEDKALENYQAGLRDGQVNLPKDFDQTVNILAMLDEYEWVGHKQQKDHRQTPLDGIVSKVAEVVRTPAEKPDVRVEIFSKEPVLPKPDLVVADEKDAIATIRTNLEKAKASAEVAPASQEKAVDREKRITKERLSGKNPPVPDALINFALAQEDYIDRSIDLERLDFTKKKNKIGDVFRGGEKVSQQMSDMIDNPLVSMAMREFRGETDGKIDADPIIGVADYILAQVNANPKNPVTRDMAFHLLNHMTQPANFPDAMVLSDREEVIKRVTALSSAFAGKNLNRLQRALSHTFDGNELFFNLHADQKFSVAGQVTNILMDGNGQLRPEAFYALNDPMSADFLGRLYNANDRDPNQAFFYNINNQIETSGYHVEETNFAKEAGGPTYKLIKKQVSTPAPGEVIISMKEELSEGKKITDVISLTQGLYYKEFVDQFEALNPQIFGYSNQREISNLPTELRSHFRRLEKNLAKYLVTNNALDGNNLRIVFDNLHQAVKTSKHAIPQKLTSLEAYLKAYKDKLKEIEE